MILLKKSAFRVFIGYKDVKKEFVPVAVMHMEDLTDLLADCISREEILLILGARGETEVELVAV